MRYYHLSLALGLFVGATVPGFAQASAPAEKIVCTQAPRSSWLPEARIREIFEEKRFTLAKLKISRGNCYEFYAVEKNGNVIEAYYHPISGEVVRYNRVMTSNTASEYESRSTAPDPVR